MRPSVEPAASCGPLPVGIFDSTCSDAGSTNASVASALFRTSSVARRRCVMSLPRREVAFQPLREPVEAGEEHAFGDVGLIEFVAYFPFQFRRNDDAAIHRFAPLQKFFEGQLRARGK